MCSKDRISLVSEEKSKMSQPIRACGGHLGFSIGSKNTILVEGIEYLLPVRFGEIPCSGFRGEVENVKKLTPDDGRRTPDDGRRTTDGAL